MAQIILLMANIKRAMANINREGRKLWRKPILVGGEQMAIGYANAGRRIGPILHLAYARRARPEGQ